MSSQPNTWRSFSPSPSSSKLDDNDWPPLPSRHSPPSFSQPVSTRSSPDLLHPVHTHGPVRNAKREAETFPTSPPKVKKNRVKKPECIFISSSSEDEQEHVLTSRNASKTHLTPMKDAKHKQDVFFNKCQLSLTTSDFTTELDDDLPEPEDMFSIMTKNADSSEDEPPLIRKRHRQPCSKDQITIDSDDDLPEPEDLFSIITKKADNSENMVPLIGKHHRQPRSKDQITIDSDDNLPEPKDLFPRL
jgi:hypothetical protein